MSYIFLQELGEESSVESFADIPASVLSKLNLTHERYCCNGSGTKSCHASQSGTTCELSTESHGEEKLTSFAAASRAKTLAQPEKAQDSTASEAASGLKCLGSLARFDLDSRSWKTHQFSLLGGLESFSETWPRWGMMRGGECWELSTPTRLTSENESGSLPTPWPTPTVCGNYNRKGASKNSGDGLATVVRRYPTPGANEDSYRLNGNSQQSNSLGAIARREALAESPESGGQLNPTWVEWLMGWPLGWTDSAPLGTDKFQAWLDSHGKL
jgi:hypothetical protein